MCLDIPILEHKNLRYLLIDNNIFLEIPYFKEITTIEILCGYCGHKACNEVKYIGSSSDNIKCNGSNQTGDEAKGTRISFNLTNLADMKRKLLKVCSKY